MGECVKRISKQAARAMREIFGEEPTPGENPLLELMGLLLGDGSGDVQSPPAVPITNQQWLDWHYLTLMNPRQVIAVMEYILRSEQTKLPSQQEVMRIWAACLLLSTLDQLEMM